MRTCVCVRAHARICERKHALSTHVFALMYAGKSSEATSYSTDRANITLGQHYFGPTRLRANTMGVRREEQRGHLILDR